MKKLFSRFLKDESGATAIEYGLIAALISVALITGATTLGNNLNRQFDAIAQKLNYGQAATQPDDDANGG